MVSVPVVLRVVRSKKRRKNTNNESKKKSLQRDSNPRAHLIIKIHCAPTFPQGDDPVST